MEDIPQAEALPTLAGEGEKCFLLIGFNARGGKGAPAHQSIQAVRHKEDLRWEGEEKKATVMGGGGLPENKTPPKEWLVSHVCLFLSLLHFLDNQ